MSTALHSPASTAATAAVPSAASETVKPLRSSARRMSRREPASSSTMSTWMGSEGVLLGTSGYPGVVERFELGEGDGALSAQLGHGGGQVGDITASRQVFDLTRDRRDVRGAEVGARALQGVRRARDVLGITDLQGIFHVGEQLRGIVAIKRDQPRQQPVLSIRVELAH